MQRFRQSIGSPVEASSKFLPGWSGVLLTIRVEKLKIFFKKYKKSAFLYLNQTCDFYSNFKLLAYSFWSKSWNYPVTLCIFGVKFIKPHTKLLQNKNIPLTKMLTKRRPSLSMFTLQLQIRDKRKFGMAESFGRNRISVSVSEIINSAKTEFGKRSYKLMLNLQVMCCRTKTIVLNFWQLSTYLFNSYHADTHWQEITSFVSLAVFNVT